MNPVRLIYDDTPDFIPIPEALRHRKTEIIVWPLIRPTQRHPATGRRLASPALAESGDRDEHRPASDWHRGISADTHICIVDQSDHKTHHGQI